MEVFNIVNLPSLHLHWEVTRGKTLVREDFSGAHVCVFLTGDNGMIPLSVEIVHDVIKCDLPTDLPPGEYGVKAIWVKDGTGGRCLNELLACNKRCVSEVFSIFGISDSPYADANTRGSVTIRIRSAVATYGYDGLSAYERAVMLGLTNMSEREWLISPLIVFEAGDKETAFEIDPETMELYYNGSMEYGDMQIDENGMLCVMN